MSVFFSTCPSTKGYQSHHGTKVKEGSRSGSQRMGVLSRLHLDRWTVSLTPTLDAGTRTDLFESNAHYPPHTHAGVTTHLVLKGSLTLTYPDDPRPKKEQCNVGDRFDVDANKRHEVWIGPEGCTYVIGE
jgi:hypothetical protein